MGKTAHSTCVEVNILVTVFTHVTATENERSWKKPFKRNMNITHCKKFDSIRFWGSIFSFCETVHPKKGTTYRTCHGNPQPSCLGGYNPYIEGLKPSLFMVLGSKGGRKPTYPCISHRIEWKKKTSSRPSRNCCEQCCNVTSIVAPKKNTLTSPKKN